MQVYYNDWILLIYVLTVILKMLQMIGETWFPFTKATLPLSPHIILIHMTTNSISYDRFNQFSGNRS